MNVALPISRRTAQPLLGCFVRVVAVNTHVRTYTHTHAARTRNAPRHRAHTMSRGSPRLRLVYAATRPSVECKRSSDSAILLIAACLVGLNASPIGAKTISTLDNGGKEDLCPVECSCLGNLVACSELQLVEAPSGLPPWTEIL